MTSINEQTNTSATAVGTPILVVSDDPVIALDLEMSLNASGFQPLVKNSSSTDASAADPQSCAAAIVDIQRLDDRTQGVLDALNASDIPVVAISTQDLNVRRDVPSVLACYSKPIVVDDLVKTIEQATAIWARDAYEPPVEFRR